MPSKNSDLAKPAAGATTASTVYDRLKVDVLQGAFPAGSKLVIDTLSQRYAVGPIPLREALNRLSAERFVAQADQRGFFMPRVSIEELRELTRTRCLLHRILVPDALAAGEPAWEERLVVAAHYLFKTPRTPSGSERLNPEWEKRHRAFHLCVIDGSPSPWLKHFYADLFDYADRYRHQYLSAEMSLGDRHVDQEHRRIFETAVARSSEALIELLDIHTTRTTDIIAASVTGAEDRPAIRTVRRRVKRVAPANSR